MVLHAEGHPVDREALDTLIEPGDEIGGMLTVDAVTAGPILSSRTEKTC